jgi:hypothetical protein
VRIGKEAILIYFKRTAGMIEKNKEKLGQDSLSPVLNSEHK